MAAPSPCPRASAAAAAANFFAPASVSTCLSAVCATASAAVVATSAAVTTNPASFVMPLGCGLDGAGFGEHAAIESQGLADRPRLERAAARRVRRVAVGDLGEMPEA